MARPKSEKDKKRDDDNRLLRAWKKFHHEQREAVLAGPHGAVLGELFRMFENLQHIRPSQLIGFARAIDWAAIDCDTRLVVLHEANISIATFREKRGLDPIDDPLPGEPSNAFRMIREIITKVSLPPQEKANSGVVPG